MRHAVLDDDGTVINLIEGSVPGLNLAPADDATRIGMRWDGQVFWQPPAPPPPVPESISPRQFRQAINKFGFRQQVDAAVAASADVDLKDWYEYTSEFQRHHPKILAMASALGFTSDQLDQVWIYGAAL